jgi:hypothetical protein
VPEPVSGGSGGDAEAAPVATWLFPPVTRPGGPPRMNGYVRGRCRRAGAARGES